MVVPVGNQAAQQLGLAQEGTVGRRGAAQHKMVAAAGAGVAAIVHEFFSRQARLMRDLVQKLGVLDQLAPAVGRVDIDFDDTRVGRDLQHFQARVARRRIAFQHDPDGQAGGCGFDRSKQVQVVVESLQRWHEDIQRAAARRLRRPSGSAGRLLFILVFFRRLGGGSARPCGVAHLYTEGNARQPGGRFVRLRRPRRSRSARKVKRIGWIDRIGAVAVAAGQTARRRQLVPRRKGIGFDQVGKIGFGDPRHRVKRQAVTHGRVAGRQVHPSIAEKPGAGGPLRAGRLRPTGRRAGVTHRQRQHIAGDGIQALREHPAKALALHRVVQTGIERIDVHRQAALAPEVVPGVFVARREVARRQTELARQRFDEAFGVGAGVVAAPGAQALVGEKRRVLPDGLAVLAPENAQRPARQLFAGIPLALAEMQKATLAVLGAQLLYQLGGMAAFGRAQCIDIPFGRVAVYSGHKSRLAAHGQPHVAGHQVAVHHLAQRQHLSPLRLGVGLRDPRRLVDTLHAHVVRELDLAFVNAPFHRRGA